MSDDPNKVRVRHTNPAIDVLIQDAYSQGKPEHDIVEMVPVWEQSLATLTEEATRKELGLPVVGAPPKKREVSETERRVRKSTGLDPVNQE